MSHEPGNTQTAVDELVNEAWKMYRVLDIVLPHRESRPPGPLTRRKVVASSPDWHAHAAGLVLDLHSAVRRIECDLIAIVSGRTKRPRGGDDRHTWLALRSIGRLCHAVDDATTTRVAGYLDGWLNRCYAVFDDRQGLHQLPHSPGESVPRCPHCTFRTLRWHPITGTILCINPDCRDDDGNRPRWNAALNVVDGTMEWSWEAAA